MDAKLRKLITLVVVFGTVIPLLFVAYRMSNDLGTEMDNRYFLEDLAEWGAEILEEKPGLDRETLNLRLVDRAGRRYEIRGKHAIVDAWGMSVRFREIDPGRFECRSAGKDQEFGTEDDRYCRFEAGKVTEAPPT